MQPKCIVTQEHGGNMITCADYKGLTGQLQNMNRYPKHKADKIMYILY